VALTFALAAVTNGNVRADTPITSASDSYGNTLNIYQPSWDNVNNTLTQNCGGSPASGWQNNIGSVSLYTVDGSGNETFVSAQNVTAGATWSATFTNIQRNTHYRFRTLETFYNPGFPPLIRPCLAGGLANWLSPT
jgi:hypothetical protein